MCFIVFILPRKSSQRWMDSNLIVQIVCLIVIVSDTPSTSLRHQVDSIFKVQILGFKVNGTLSALL